MDILELDPEVLDTTADIIEGYCDKQSSVMDQYVSNIMSLNSEWSDDTTFGSLLEEVKALQSGINELMGEIRKAYPGYFRSKAEYIRSRPKL